MTSNVAVSTDACATLVTGRVFCTEGVATPVKARKAVPKLHPKATMALAIASCEQVRSLDGREPRNPLDVAMGQTQKGLENANSIKQPKFKRCLC